MSGNKISLKTIEDSAINQILEISRLSNITLWTYKDYTDEIKRPDSYSIACLDIESGKVIGFMAARLIKSNNVFHPSNTVKKDCEGEAEILNIAVLPAYQNRGVGKTIFNHFIKFCSENRICAVYLEVRESNKKAAHFYLKNGFKAISSRKNYYSNPPEDAVVMKLSLFDD